MKRLVSIVAIALISIASFAQSPEGTTFGIFAGYTSSSTKVSDWSTKNASAYQAGIALRVPMGAGFVFQPGLAYQVKSADIKKDDASTVVNSIKTSVGYVEADTQFQWGPDLMVFRPFLLVDPFLGYAVNTKAKASGGSNADSSESVIKDAIRKIEYGLGVGGGIEFGRLQLSVKYFWNFGNLYEGDKISEAASKIGDTVKGQNSFSGVSITAGLFF